MLSDALKITAAGFFMGWGPCLVYMAPILLPYIGATQKNWKEGLKAAVLFSTGRLLAFSLLGGLATVAFRYINRFFPPHKSGWLYLVIALLMISVGTLIVLGKGLKVHIGAGLVEKSAHSMGVFGFLIGIAPCAPYIAILTYIACIAEQSIITGVLYAALFATGAAAAPIVLGALVGLVSERVYRSIRLLRVFQFVCGSVLILFGARLVFLFFRTLSFG
jgi:sulfite exporter TauE/SafE